MTKKGERERNGRHLLLLTYARTHDTLAPEQNMHHHLSRSLARWGITHEYTHTHKNSMHIQPLLRGVGGYCAEPPRARVCLSRARRAFSPSCRAPTPPTPAPHAPNARSPLCHTHAALCVCQADGATACQPCTPSSRMRASEDSEHGTEELTRAPPQDIWPSVEV